ncbi:MAG: N-acetylmuramoyl-L-alanine amidase [Lachnospiraceae bacterium]|nr:N-acetylmuramoyl-L-alanine amidase [Lachnospiraceae bacterium]
MRDISRKTIIVGALCLLLCTMVSCGKKDPEIVDLYPVKGSYPNPLSETEEETGEGAEQRESRERIPAAEQPEDVDIEEEAEEHEEPEETASAEITKKEVYVTKELEYADFSKVKSGAAILYTNPDPNRGSYVICVNAGHGSREAAREKTLCHPDGTPKVTGGSTAAGSTTAVAASGGMAFPDGTGEGVVTLQQSIVLRDVLLDAGYSVLMIRETEDVSLDNIARTVLANKYADCHIAIHWDSSETDKGAFYCSVPNIESYRKMEPVASTWQKSHALGDSIIDGLREAGVTIYGNGAVPLDLTQTSYSTVASIDLELGDKASDRSEAMLRKNADGILAGLDQYFQIEQSE